MEEMYGLHSNLDYHHHHHPSMLPEATATPVEYHSFRERIPVFAGSEHMFTLTAASSSALSETEAASMVAEIQNLDHHDDRTTDISTVIKAKIASHPRYPALLEAYIDCRKVGAPPEIAGFLEEIRRECKRNTILTRIGADPELDHFMESYCDVLLKYKSDLVRPLDEANAFLNKIQLQLSNLCKGPSRTCFSDEAAGSSEDDCSGDIDIVEFQSRSEDRDLKDKLLRKYSGYISNLKHEFSKKKKKGKLPKEARQILLEWWNMHYKWPYPTEADKIALAESTGLDQKQINNWFINQRKRHWKPSENMQFAVMDSLSAPFYIDD